MNTSISTALLSSALLAAFLVQSAARADIVPSGPAATKYGKFILQGHPSLDPVGETDTSIEGVTTTSATQLSGQGTSYVACPVKVKSTGELVGLSSAEDSYGGNCIAGELGKFMALAAGTYVLVYGVTHTIVHIQADQKNVVTLQKIRAPYRAATDHVTLHADYTSEAEQNRYFVRLRTIAEDADYLNGIRASRWGHRYFEKFFLSGNVADITPEMRSTFFTPDGSVCSVNDEGRANSCSWETIGEWSRQGFRRVCHRLHESGVSFFLIIPHGYSYDTSKCDSTEMNYPNSSAYFIVPSGTYTMVWNEDSHTETTGIVAP